VTNYAPRVEKKATYCYQCVAGPDLLTVKVVDGVATEVEPNFAAAAIHPGGGRVCVKAYGLVQKLYNPHRVRTPMKRTNPKKGRDEDPGFVPISWDEALDTIAQQLLAIRAKGLTDNSGYPRVAASFGGGGTPQSYMGTFPAFLGAWGPVDMGFGSGQGVKCTHSEHLYGEFWHRAFTVSPDTPLCEYVISCGANTEASGGVVGVWRHADARIRGMKRVQVEPHLSVTGACSAEWVPIKPKTDPAFLYALMHVMLHEHPRERLDVNFLLHHTASPYLVGPHGFYLRDRQTRQPLLAGTLEESVTADAIEIGADDEVLAQGALEGETAFLKLLAHMKPSGPGLTLAWRSESGLFRRTVVPSVPPGTSSAPTRAASIVRAQQHSNPPQPLLTVLPSATATGRNGRVLPSMTMVSPIRACARYSPAMRRIVAAGTSQIAAAHSGEYGFMWASSFRNAVSPARFPCARTSSSAPISIASAVTDSSSAPARSGSRVSGSRR